MEYTIDQEVLDKADQYVDEPEYFEDEVVEKSAPTTKAQTVTTNRPKSYAKRSNTKQALANEQYRKHQGDRTAVINFLMEDLGMSKAGATTYFYNAKKAAKAGV